MTLETVRTEANVFRQAIIRPTLRQPFGGGWDATAGPWLCGGGCAGTGAAAGFGIWMPK
jgi:hypothetical protein